MSKHTTKTPNSRQHKRTSFLKDNAGFSLVELGIVLIIGAIMTIPIYTLLFYVNTLRPTDERMEIIQEALAEHLRVTGTLPCPADITLDIDSSANAYRGRSDASGTCTNSISAGNAYIGAVPIHNLKVATDCASNNGDVPLLNDAAGALKDSIYSLAEVFSGTRDKTNGFDGSAVESTKAENVRCPLNEYILDEHGHKFVYAVSQAATQVGFDVFTPLKSVDGITIQDTAGNTLSNTQAYALVDLGADGKGGYDRSGTLSGGTCGTSDGDSENCDYNDDIFVASPEILSSGGYYDDLIDYNIAGFMQEDSFWGWAGNDGSNSDVLLNPRVMLVIGSEDPNNAATAAAISDLASANDDGLVVNRGGIRIGSDLTVHAQEYYDGTQDVIAGGNVSANNTLTADTSETNIKNYAISAKYCYEPTEALTDGCGAIIAIGCSEALPNYNMDGSCAPADEHFSCPPEVYESNGDCLMYWD